jgi:hypothetical protein
MYPRAYFYFQRSDVNDCAIRQISRLVVLPVMENGLSARLNNFGHDGRVRLVLALQVDLALGIAAYRYRILAQ